jgi:hypothetical protein
MPLIINGTLVHNISGPVSMYILTPKSTSSNLPVYMLFGDIHKSNEHTCYNKTEGYTNISDISFLQLLSRLVVKLDEKIDFYFEGGDLHNRTYGRSLTALYPLHKIQKIAAECYKNIKPNKHQLLYYPKTIDCRAIPNIRWQSGDLRHFDDPKFVKSLDNCNIYSFFLELDCNTFVNSFKENPEEDDDEEHDDELLKEFIDNFNEAFVNFKRRYTETPCITKLLSTTLEFTDIQTQLLSESGLVMRQLRHMKPEEKKEISGNIIQYCEDIKRQNASLIDRNIQRFHSEIIHILKNLDKDIKSFNKDSYTLIEPDRKFTEYLRANIDTLIKYNNLLVKNYSIFTDIYTICRSFKYFKVKQDKPILNIFYFGNYHITNMVYFLEKLSGLYDCKTVQEYKRGQTSRCIKITENINLNIIVDQNRDIPIYVKQTGPMAFKKSKSNPKRILKKSLRKSKRKSKRKSIRKSKRKSKRKSVHKF